MKILVCGYGFVGRCHLDVARELDKGVVYDPPMGFGDETLFKSADAVIVAVSTPEAEDGSCDMTNVYDVVGRVPDYVPILIKSTISLAGWRFMKSEFPNKPISFSPEYLRANHAVADFKAQTAISIGGGNELFWREYLYGLCQIIIQDPEMLILTKYFRNSFLAMKVAFFNQVYDMAVAEGIEDPRQLTNSISDDPRIGKSHTYVHKDDRGYGGHCFPKDVAALLHTAHLAGVDLSILSEAMQYNERLRDESRNNL